ncbi:MAG: type IV pilus assembly protein PilM [Patescibacteria group bacterium]
MSILSGVSDFFGLDIGSTAIRVVQLSTGPKKQLLRYGMMPIETKVALSDSKGDQQKVAAKIQEVMAAAKITTNNVAVGLPSSRVFTMVTDIDRLPAHELSKSIKYQADSLIPTPIEDSKIDWAVIGDSPESSTKMELLLSSVTNDYVESRLDLLESIGLNVIAFEPDNLVLTRSMLPPDTTTPHMVIDIGSLSTDIVITINNVPRLIRAVPTGSEAIIKSAMSNLSIDEKQASEFVFKFGLSQQKLEGQVYNAIIGTIDLLVSDIEKSIKFFQTRYKDQKLERIVMTGAASSLPEFPLHIANKLGVNVEIGNSWRNVIYDPTRQNELMSLSNHFGVAVGLAERNV